MKTSTQTAATLEQEHQAIEQEVAAWRRWWDELSQMGQPHFGEMGDRLARFRERLSAHFQSEEFRGPLAGRPGPEVAALWREHAQMLAELDLLVARLHRCGPDVGCWGSARHDFESLLDRLHAHEQRETELIRAAG
jgi:hypothetical protein